MNVGKKSSETGRTGERGKKRRTTGGKEDEEEEEEEEEEAEEKTRREELMRGTGEKQRAKFGEQVKDEEVR